MSCNDSIEKHPTEPHCLTWRRRRNTILRQAEHISSATLEHIELYQDYYKELEEKQKRDTLTSVEKDLLKTYYKALADIYQRKLEVGGGDVYFVDGSVFGTFLQDFPEPTIY